MKQTESGALLPPIRLGKCEVVYINQSLKKIGLVITLKAFTEYLNSPEGQEEINRCVHMTCEYLSAEGFLGENKNETPWLTQKGIILQHPTTNN